MKHSYNIFLIFLLLNKCLNAQNDLDRVRKVFEASSNIPLINFESTDYLISGSIYQWSDNYAKADYNRLKLPNHLFWGQDGSPQKLSLMFSGETKKMLLKKYTLKKDKYFSLKDKPFLKLWICIIDPDDKDKKTYIWMQNGFNNHHEIDIFFNQQFPIEPLQTLELGDLSFLKQYVSPDLAQQYQW